MKLNSIQKIGLTLFFIVISCDEPETVVTNIIHTDGSVTRKIEMRNVKNVFNPSDLQVPFDSTWTVKDSIEVNEKGDTTWVKRAEKLFPGFEEINSTYVEDTSVNKSVSRHAMLNKKFKWFNTEYRFSEMIDRQLNYGYPVQEFMNHEQLEYFYSPAALIAEKRNGPDSLKYNTLSDSVDQKTENWLIKTFIAGWINEFGRLTGNNEIAGSLKNREQEVFDVLSTSTDEIDSLWNNGILLREFIGEADAIKYKIEGDSAIQLVTDQLFMNFKNYSVRIVMPGILTSTNGFVDNSKVLLWPVKSEYFLTQPYEMWAVSKVPNTWAWIVSAFFVLFVLTGMTIWIKRKG